MMVDRWINKNHFETQTQTQRQNLESTQSMQKNKIIANHF